MVNSEIGAGSGAAAAGRGAGAAAPCCCADIRLVDVQLVDIQLVDVQLDPSSSQMANTAIPVVVLMWRLTSAVANSRLLSTATIITGGDGCAALVQQRSQVVRALPINRCMIIYGSTGPALRARDSSTESGEHRRIAEQVTHDQLAAGDSMASGVETGRAPGHEHLQPVHDVQPAVAVPSPAGRHAGDQAGCAHPPVRAG
jgi:hypothetical protein